MDRYTFWTIAGCFFLLSAALFRVGFLHQEWTGFAVSEAHLMICAVGAFILLRPASDGGSDGPEAQK